MLAVLNARRAVLKKTVPSREENWRDDFTDDQEDPFAFESRGFYAPFVSDVPRSKSVRKRVKPPILPRAIIKKPEKTKTRFLPNWTPQLDKMLRKCLRKFGWGSWTRMEQSGKFPKNYSRKILSRRALTLGYTKEMFTMGGAAKNSKK